MDFSNDSREELESMAEELYEKYDENEKLKQENEKFKKNIKKQFSKTLNIIKNMEKIYYGCHKRIKVNFVYDNKVFIQTWIKYNGEIISSGSGFFNILIHKTHCKNPRNEDEDFYWRNWWVDQMVCNKNFMENDYNKNMEKIKWKTENEMEDTIRMRMKWYCKLYELEKPSFIKY